MAEREAAPLRSKVERENVRESTVAIVTFEGDLDLPVVESFHTALSPESVGAADAVILDLTGIRFIDSSGIHALLTARKALDEAGDHSRTVVAAGSSVERVLQISGVAEELAPVPDRDAAREAIAGEG
jgi:anti-sigma B factor antagonist